MAAIGLSGLWLADMAMGPMAQFDSRLYHFQAIKWARNYPVVPGLANLYGPLGFNNACFLYGALMQAGPWGVFAHHVTNSSLVYAMLVQCLLAGWKLLNGREDSNAFFDFCLLVPVVTLINKDIAGYTTDLPTTLTLLQAMSVLYCFLTSRDSSSMVSAYRVVNITVLVTLAVCFKFGSIVYAAGVWALVWACGYGVRRQRAL